MWGSFCLVEIFSLFLTALLNLTCETRSLPGARSMGFMVVPTCVPALLPSKALVVCMWLQSASPYYKCGDIAPTCRIVYLHVTLFRWRLC